MTRNPYVALMAASVAGEGLTLTAEEVASLSQVEVVQILAENALNEPGRGATDRHGWAYLLSDETNAWATSQSPGPEPTPGLAPVSAPAPARKPGVLPLPKDREGGEPCRFCRAVEDCPPGHCRAAELMSEE